VLDVGCAQQAPRALLSPSAQYVGLDYYATASEWYGTRPDVYGDAHALPFADSSIDNVLLLDVMEHLPCPKKALSEIRRVLVPHGRVSIQVPFIYPIHDAPLDFQRWTVFGLRRLAEECGFSVAEEHVYGSAPECAALMVNLATGNLMLSLLDKRSLLSVLLPVAPLVILVANLLALAFSRVQTSEPFMATGYRVLWTRQG